MLKYLPIIFAAFLVATAGYNYWGKEQAPVAQAASSTTKSRFEVDVKVPALEGNQLIGEKIFAAKCSACHGENAGGIEGSGPPLVHKIYEPSHHGDGAFIIAAKNGVRSHHWRYGNMPPVDGVTNGDVKMVIEYIRALQRANGIN